MIRLWQAHLTRHHSINQKKQLELNRLILSTQRIKPRVVRRKLSSKRKTGLRVVLHISTTIQQTVLLSKNSSTFGLNIRIKSFRKSDETKRQSKFWTNGHKHVQELKLRYCARKNTLTSLRTSKKQEVSCALTGKVRTLTQLTTPQSKIRQQMRVNSIAESWPSELTM